MVNMLDIDADTVDMLDAVDVADMVGGGGYRHGGLADAVDLPVWTQWAVDTIDMERKEGLCCSHIGSKNTSLF